ncbi:uncharacterized protein LOC108906118 [Anoplophora glabripennis]|uniref:uncharacterized protein LOC108906118 n=1 Tax=Anoplophora glabripennis TaxID=217634 RepID=UPI000873FF3A|nr:uncharacterized protein LOC108906118 [Anoplophora glabripennis]
MVAKMSEISTNICRLCLQTIQDLKVVNDSEIDIIQIVLPQIDLNCTDNHVICEDCTELLQQSFAFKSKCLEIEDSIHDFTNDNKDQVNLEKVLGIDEDDSKKICRTCLGYLESNAFTKLDRANELKLIMEQCLPEMDVELTLNPVICQLCEELLKQMYNFVTLCIQNDEKINQLYFKQNGNLNLGNTVQYELNKDIPPNMEPNPACSETNIKENSGTTIEDCVLVPEVQNMHLASSSNGHDEIYIISDTEEDTNSTETTIDIKRGKKRCASKEVDTDASTNISEDEWLSPYKRKRSRKTKVNVDPKQMIFCKYCYYRAVSEIAVRKHIPSCPRNPLLKGSLLANNLVSAKGKSKRKPRRNTKPKKKNITKYNVTIVNIITNNTTKTAEKTGQLTDIPRIMDEIGSKTVTIDDSLTVETEIVLNEFPLTEKEGILAIPKSAPDTYSPLEGTKIDYSTMKSEVINSKEKEKEIELAIKRNKKKLFSQLEILTCNYCCFNSRSNLKMALHCSSHSTSSKNTVNYTKGYKAAFYCVNCTNMFRTAQCLHNHISSCPPVSDNEVFLFKVGKVMHCAKCYFDSDDTKLVIEHLLRCGNMNEER